MLKLLIKKQLTEIFRSYYVNKKTNQKRSKVYTVFMFIFFGALMIGVLGGMFTYLSFCLCKPLCSVGFDWLYFDILVSISIVFGAFGSVFNTYYSLYKAKDNNLLLSMPIPTKYIIISRLSSVFLLGVMYSSVVSFPAVIIYWILNNHSIEAVICCIILLVLIYLIVFILSCLLGWVVAKISSKIKNKSTVIVLLSISGIALYYFLYYKAQALISSIIENAAIYGEKIKGSAYLLYLFGKIGSGDILASLLFFAAFTVIAALLFILISRSFLKIATMSDAFSSNKYKEKQIKSKSAFAALLFKELGRFKSSPNYMLNCGLGIIILPVVAIFLIIKGDFITNFLQTSFSVKPTYISVITVLIICLVSNMNDMSACSVSLEGKNIWIPNSLPVKTLTVINAKIALQIVLSAIPLLFCTVITVIIMQNNLLLQILSVLVILEYMILSSVFNTAVNIKLPLITWTNEIIPIKQSASVVIAMFAGWAYIIALGALYIFIGKYIGAIPYLALILLLNIIITVFIYIWIKKKGCAIFENL